MKLLYRQKDLHMRVSSFKVKFLALAAGLMICVFLISCNIEMSLRFPFLMWLRSDVCHTWEDANFITDGTENYNWWQRACLLERDWDQMEYTCTNMKFMGNWPVCFDKPFGLQNKNKPCIVYSFGIAYDFRFDDAMAEINCTVYSFDPSMKMPDHQRGSRIHFRKLGIAATDDMEFKPRSDGYTKPEDRWSVMTLTSIMKMLGHSPMSISLLKLDIESNEWSVLANLLDEGILDHLPQVLIEWHIFNDSPPHERYKELYENYMKFQSIGFKKFWMRSEGRNHWLPKMVTQAEVAYVNTKLK